jgi:hypothetical protein
MKERYEATLALLLLSDHGRPLPHGLHCPRRRNLVSNTAFVQSAGQGQSGVEEQGSEDLKFRWLVSLTASSVSQACRASMGS